MAVAGLVGGCSERAPRRPPCRVPPAPLPAGDDLAQARSVPLKHEREGVVDARQGRRRLGRSILLDALRPCSAHPGDAGAADRRSAAVVLVIRGDVADRGVQADCVVLGADPVKLGIERGRVGDGGEVRPVALQVAEERFDVRLVGWRSGAAVMLGDRHQRHELASVDSGHLRAVVRPCHQDRRVLRAVVGREPVRAEKILVLERPGEQQLRLRARLLGRDQVADPVAGHHVDDRVGDPLGAREVRASQIQMRLRSHGTSGNTGTFGRGRTGSPGSVTRCLSATRNSVEGETNTVPV